MCQTRPEHVRDASVEVLNFAIRLQQDMHVCHAFFPDVEHIQNLCGMHLKCMQDASGMRVNITLELSCTVMGGY